jgi:predicted DNA-binding transcriptional regulator AlpA
MTTSSGDWVITFTFDADPPMETMDGWQARLENFDGSVARIPGRGIDVTVYAPASLSIPDAIAKTIGDVTHAVEIDGPIGIEVITEHEHARRAEAPTMPELMSAAEIAEKLGITRQRVHQLRKSAAFPAPLAELGGGAVWDAAAVQKFVDAWERTPGRPRSDLQHLSR